ncbi:TfuA-like protein [Micromonospora auratinigra]|uniref:TfuA-like core domain-containing protein n=1 Tax=Micromonospora auratinigra TaxID=261654 RepID=A0A1A8Z4K4_9ACTN|nr:TfuA-like protein [Micromonospora auratinigra]SBT38780.1 hypothetical protein GA0070611_0672 [Micromonospora auratinigra]
MTTFIFAGPSLSGESRQAAATGAVLLPPVAGGDLLRLGAGPGDVVGIIDGYFQRRPAVRHKEVLDLLAAGVQVHGGASMGALRAAELSVFGMVGHGRIFRDYLCGDITADDEVALLHGTDEEGYQPYTLALVNVRYALTDARRAGLITSAVAEAVLRDAARLPFTERTHASILEMAAGSGALGSRDLGTLERVLLAAPDVKRLDAQQMIDALLHPPPAADATPTTAVRDWTLHETLHLRSWKMTARGHNDPVAGWVPEAHVHGFVQVLAADYAAFREQVATRYLAAAEPARRGTGESATPSTRSQPGGHTAPTKGMWPTGRAHRPGRHGDPRRSDEDVSRAALEHLTTLGYLSRQGRVDPGMERWCTVRERHLPPTVRVLKAAARALFPPAYLAWSDPFLDALKATGSYPAIQERFLECMRFNRALRRSRPGFVHQLRTDRMISHFTARWGGRHLADVALERGFATVDDLLAAARPFYLYDKANARRVEKDDRPIVIGG